MANDTRSSRDIERDIEQERAELRGTIDELLGRLTFEDAWERLGAYLRENRTEYGYTLRRMIQEKPIPLMLTAVGVGWLLFDRTVSHAQGPGRDDDRRRSPARSRDPGYGTPPHVSERLPKASELNAARSPSASSAGPAVHRGMGDAAMDATHNPASRSTSTPISSEASRAEAVSGSSPAPAERTAGPAMAGSTASHSSQAEAQRPSGSSFARTTATQSSQIGTSQEDRSTHSASSPSTTPAGRSTGTLQSSSATSNKTKQ